MPEPRDGLLRVCVVATPVGDEADSALDALLATIAGQLPHEVMRAWESAEDASPSFAELHECDVALICARRMPLGGEALARMQWYCQRGRPLVALRAGGGPTFARWPQFDAEVLGIDTAGISAAESGRLHTSQHADSHPILAGIGSLEFGGFPPFGIGLTSDAHVLLEYPGPDAVQPLAWSRSRGTARVFATALGCADDLREPAFATLMANAIRWVTTSRSR